MVRALASECNQTAAPLNEREEWLRYWPTVIAAMIVMSFSTVLTYSLSTFIGPLEQEFGWSRTALSSGLTIFASVTMIGAPIIGIAVDKFGTRRIVLTCITLSGCTFAALSTFNGSIAQWTALYAAYALCALGIKSTILSTGISSIFTKGRSLALAVVLSGSAIGQTLAPIASNALINAVGWRGAYIWLGIGWAGLALILSSLFYFDARSRKLQPAQASGGGHKTPNAASVSLPGLTIPQALRDHRILRIAGAALLSSLVGSGVSVHLVRIVSENAIPLDRAVEIAALAGIAGLIGKLGYGWLLDRKQSNILPVLGFLIGSLGHFCLSGILSGWEPVILGVVCLGFSSGAGMQIILYLISRYAGLRNLGTIMGTVFSMMMVGTAVGPLFAGYLHDSTGSYKLLEFIAAPIMLFTALLFFKLGRYPEFTKNSAD